MYPTIFKIGDFAIHSYGLMMALGFLCAWHIAAKLQKKSGTIKIDLSNLLFLLMVAGVLGSRVYYVIQFWHEQFAGNLLEIIRIDHGGLVFYGGLICSIATCILYCIVRKVPLVPLGDLLLCVVPLGHAFGRIGCFLNGCCYGELASKCGKVGELFNVSFPAIVDLSGCGKRSFRAVQMKPSSFAAHCGPVCPCRTVLPFFL